MKKLALLAVLLGLPFWVPNAYPAEGSVADLIEAVAGGDTSGQVEALVALEAMGPDAAGAVDAVAKALASDSADVRAHAAATLGAIGSPAKSAAEALANIVAKDPEAMVRREAIEALAAIRPGAAVMVPILGRVMKDPDPAVRHRVLSALADRAADAKELLVEALGNNETAYWACLVISEVGPELKDAVPALIKLLDHADHTVQREAALALAAIGKDAAPAAAKLETMIDDPIDGIPAIYALGSIGVVSDGLRSRLITKIQDGTPMERTVSAWALAKSHPNQPRFVRRAVTMLIEALRSDNEAVRLAAAKGLESLDADPEVVRPMMLQALESADEKTTLMMLDTLARLGPKVVPRLIKALEIEAARPYVAHVLGEIGPEAAPAVDALVKVLDDPRPKARYEAIMALAAIGPAAKPAVPALKKTLASDEEERFAAAYALGRIGRDSIDAKADLVGLLASEDEGLALVSAWALARIHPECPTCIEKAVPVLAEGLGDANPQFRREAAEGLCCFGEGAKAASEALKKALDDPDADVREVVAEALKKIGQ